MATASTKAQCFTCNKDKVVYRCEGCSKDFCLPHLTEHHEKLGQQLYEIEYDRDQFQQIILQERQNYPLTEQINQWEEDSIHKIHQTAEKCRQRLVTYTDNNIKQIENEFIELTKEMKQMRGENEFNEIDLNRLKNKLTKFNDEFLYPTNISIQQDSSSSFINKISIISLSVLEQNKWKQHGITMAGGNRKGYQSNQLSRPHGIFVDNDKTIYIADCLNHRIIQWKCHQKKGQLIAGGDEHGDENDYLDDPIDLIVDKQNNSLIISDTDNRRVVRWSTENQTNQQILISDIDCYGLAMDRNGFIYVSDVRKNEVRRWKQGDTYETVVAGGNGKGNLFNQLNYPTYLFVDRDDSIYISDCGNHRVMKWKKGEKEGIIVAGGNGQGNNLDQLSNPKGVFVDDLGQIYVADSWNNRVMCWREGDAEGSIVIGENRQGKESNQLHWPSGLSMDVEGNLYVADCRNNRVQKFEMDFFVR